MPKKWYFPLTTSYWIGERCVESIWMKKLKKIRLFNWIDCMSDQVHRSTSACNEIHNDFNRNSGMSVIVFCQFVYEMEENPITAKTFD